MSEDGDREALRYHLIRADLSPEELERPINRIAGTRLVSDKAPLPLAERRRASRASPTAHRACAQQRPARARGRGRRFTAPFGEGNWCRRNGRPRSDAPMARRRCRGSRTLRISEPTGTTLMPAQQPTIVSSVVDWFTAPTRRQSNRRTPSRLGFTAGGPAPHTIVLSGRHCSPFWSNSANSPAGAVDLAAHIVSCLSYHAVWSGDASSVQLIRLARRTTTPETAPAVPALLASREGRAHAAAGDLTECAKSLEFAAAVYTTRRSGADPGPKWAYWISQGVLVADAGRAWLEAGAPDRAVALLSQGLELIGVDQPRNRSLHSLSPSVGYLQLGQIAAAADAAEFAARCTMPTPEYGSRSGGPGVVPSPRAAVM